MVGKHIFVRCRNEQNNAGTWTAAMTEGIVDKSIVRDFIEPRCNIDETFAKVAMSSHTSNVLRMYYINGDTLVVTRTYWVTDRLTEAQARKGAYSISYILTDEDIAKFCSDYSGAFDDGCFETYDGLVARAENSNGKITICPDGDIFSHAAFNNDISILKNCGFTKESFISLMNGLYDAVENNKQIAVILSKSIREAWENDSKDNTTEKLAHYILGILPDFMRVNVGFASHWSCKTNDLMLGDIHLVFVHPQENEDITKQVKDSGAYFLDLDSGKYTTNIPDIASSYFAFLWDNLDNMSVCEEFWTYCKTNFKKLLRGRPTNAAAMECIFLMRQNMEEKYVDKEKCRRALLLAAEQFAGAGTRIPVAEEFIYEAINGLGIDALSDEKNMENAIGLLVSNDTEKTKHQFLSYRILLNRIIAGSASPETVKILCDEVVKEERNAVPYFFSFFKDNANTLNELPTLRMLELVSGLFTTILNNDISSSYELQELIMRYMRTVTEIVFEEAPERIDLIYSVIQAYITYVKSEEIKTDWLRAAYSYLFYVFEKSSGELFDISATALQKEEVRIYKNLNNRNGNSLVRMSEFSELFFDEFPVVLDAGREVIEVFYDRLFRMIFNPIPEISEKAYSLYKTYTGKLLEKNSGFVQKIQQLVLISEKNVLNDRLPNWDVGYAEKMTVAVENTNLELFPGYVPTEEHFEMIVKQLNSGNDEIYPLIVEYLRRMSFDARQFAYKVIEGYNMVDRLFVYVLLYTDSDELKLEINGVTTLSSEDALKNIYRYHNAEKDDEAAINRFLIWYKNVLSELSGNNPQTDFPAQYAFIKKELEFYDSIPNKDSGIVCEGYREFYNAVFDILNGIPSDLIGRMTDDAIDGIVNICSRSPVERELKKMDVIDFIKEFDYLIKQGESRKIREICENGISDEEANHIIRNRLSLYLKIGKCPAKNACRIYGIMMEARTLNDYPLEKYLELLNFESLNDFEKGMILVDLITQLHNDSARIEGIVGVKVMNYLEEIADKNPQSLINQTFINRWKLVNNFDYTRGTKFVRVMNAAVRNKNVKFDGKMFLLSVLALIVTCIVMSVLVMSVIKLATISTLILTIVSIVVLGIFVVGDILLCNNLLSSNGRRNNR